MLPLSATEAAARGGSSSVARPRRAAPEAVRRRSSAISSSGDLGESTYVRGQPALRRRLRLPARARSQLVAVGMLIAVVLSIPLGVIASRKPGGTTDRVLDHAQPDRALDAAVLPRLHAAHHLHGASCSGSRPGPAAGRTSSSRRCALRCRPIGRLSMVVRSSMIDELNTQYVKVAAGEGPEPAPHPRRARAAQRRHPVRHAARLGDHPRRRRATPSWSSRSSTGRASASWPRRRSRTRTSSSSRRSCSWSRSMVVIINIAIDIAYKVLDPRVKLA